MKPNQVKILDKLFSKVIRLRANGFCPKCKTYHKVDEIVPAHFYSRTLKSTRWDEDNVQGVCPSCHDLFHKYESIYTEFIYERLGEERFKALVVKARIPAKMDYTTIKTQLQNRIKELQNG
jgi:5-methylcytosine-specific restriction endonuclease McrA